MADVKTTIELPDTLYRKLKSTAAEEGTSIKQILTWLANTCTEFVSPVIVLDMKIGSKPT